MTWFGKKKTPDGTTIIHHKPAERRLGFTDQTTFAFLQAREAVYQRLFLEALSVSHEVLPQVPHIDVYTFQRSRDSQTTTVLVTGGMSDLPMTVHPREMGVPRRVELIFYCHEPREEYISTLRWLAHFLHNANSWLGYGHTMPNGNPPAPFWGSEAMDTVLFMPPIVMKDQTLPTELILGSDPVHLLWVVPLTTAECNFKLKNGFDAIVGLLQQHRHPYVFDPARKSYV